MLNSLKVFEDENEAARYCDLLQGGGQGCEGVAEIEASSVRKKLQSYFQESYFLVVLIAIWPFYRYLIYAGR